MSTNDYVDLTIVDCNRAHSIQANSGNNSNPALFTNELGDGIDLNVGDRVAVQAAYISEIGAGADTIELKGQSLNSNKTITYTVDNDLYPTTLEDTGIPLITGKQELTSTEKTHTFIPKDNETSIITEHYLTAGGDNGTIFLPRRWAWDTPTGTESDPVQYWSDNWNRPDSVERGRPHYELSDRSFVVDDYMWIDTSNASDTTTGFYRLRTDNSRYTLMRAHNTKVVLRETIERPEGNLSGNFSDIYFVQNTIYKTYKNKIDLKVTPGFNSPGNLSAEITTTLKNANPGKVFQQKIDGVIHDLTVTYDTNTFQPFLCASSRTMSKAAWGAFHNVATGSTATVKQESLDYQSNYYNVYHKRPEVRDTGQTLMGTQLGLGYTTSGDILPAARTTAVVYTSIPWAEIHNFGKFIQAQGIYPELFSNQNAQEIQPAFNNIVNSVDNMRFIHCNYKFFTTLGFLGGDNVGLAKQAQSEQSLPLFFYFDKNNDGVYTDGKDINNLSYGVATNHLGFIALHPEKIGGINNDLFINSENGKINSGTKIGFDFHYTAYGTAALIGSNGRLELDYGSANCWGIGDKNRIIQADQAEQKASADAEAKSVLCGTATPTGEHLRYNYVGAINPIFDYDIGESRFFFKQLHTNELTGQSFFSAGDTGVAVNDGFQPAPDNTQTANNTVYKINKRINEYVYTPDMRPYDIDFTVDYSYGGAKFPDTTTTDLVDRKLSNMNRNISPWAIFDCPTGVFITDFGFTEDQWDSCLWNLLGWDYESLNSKIVGGNNRLQRVDNSNKQELGIVTTNSDIVSTDTRDYIVNQFGASIFTTQIPTPSTVGPNPLNTHAKAGRQQFSPAISQNTVSLRLIAPNLPRKMLKPYYCIRSDIIDQAHYLGGEDNEAKLPVVAVCDKQYSGNDFIFSSESDYVFTITKKKRITSITSSIHDPNQQFSRVNNDSAIIYKISKNVRNQLGIAQMVMEEEQERMKKKNKG